MKLYELLEGVGRITKYNQTADVGPNETAIQAAKFGSRVNKDGYPPLLGNSAIQNTLPNIRKKSSKGAKL